MNPAFTLKFVTVCEAYFTLEEFAELAELFEVQIDALTKYEPRWLSVCREITVKLEHGSTRAFVDNILEFAERRNNDDVAHQTWERRDFHMAMVPILAETRELLNGSATPSEVTVSAGHGFTAKSKVRNWLPLRRLICSL